MHYAPESPQELLRDAASSDGSSAEEWAFHHRTAPLYALTLLVGGLLVADWVIPRGSQPLVGVIGGSFALWAALVGGARILYFTLDGLVSGRVGADLALTIACLGAIILGEHQTAALVVLIALIGESLEGYTLDRARRAVRERLALQPPIAHVCIDRGELDRPVAELVIGDVLAIRPGERIPIDGTILSGQTTIDESLLTGEVTPVGKQVGEAVWAGTLNQYCGFQIQVTRLAAETTLAQIANCVQSAVLAKTQGERIADRLGRVFLPAVLIAAALTFLGWRLATGSIHGAWLPALAVLVVACPCPLVLATPCAVLATLAGLTKQGVIVKRVAALERLARVDTLAFDKTGTLTHGRMTVASVVPLGETSRTQLLGLAAVAELRSEHWIARAIVEAAEAEGAVLPQPYEFQSVPGSGVAADVRSSALGALWPQSDAPRMIHLIVGTADWLRSNRVSLTTFIEAQVAELAEAGERPFFVAAEGVCLGVIGLRESVREESRGVLTELRELGITRTALLTGDRAAGLPAVLQELPPFETVATEQTPLQKADWVRAQQALGHRVAMIGDGVNDAPALAVADVGIVVGRPGGDLAAEAGDLLLLGDPLRPLASLVRGARAMVENIQTSIFWFAFGVNGLGVLASSLGWLSPVAAALFHEAASLAVMVNALRLLWRRDPVSSPEPSVTSVWDASFERWSAWLSPAAWVYRFLAHWQVCVRIGVAVLVAAYFCSGVMILDPAEVAVVSRFGRHQAELRGGWHWRWPVPFERVVRLRPERLATVTLGFRLNAGREDASEKVVDWTSDHHGAGTEEFLAEGLLLTADELLVELTAEAVFQIRDPAAFVYHGGESAEALLRWEFAAVLRELASRSPLDAWLTESRADLEQTALLALQERASGLGFGIEIVAVQLLDVHPPGPVVAAYRQVADALEDQERQKNLGEATAARTMLSAAGAGVAPSDPATAWPPMTDALWETWKTGALGGTAAATLEAAAVKATEQRTQADATAARLRALQQVAGSAPERTLEILTWQAVTVALGQRPLYILDPRAVQRQQWWLFESPATSAPLSIPLLPPREAGEPNH